ncbi:protein SRG1-like [Nymphaea colorata]|nr:protein SRG1-like [Nymphaea colorata]
MESLGSSLPVPNVQELAKENISAVPDRYIRPDREAAIVSGSDGIPNIPVIDFQSLFDGESAPAERERLHRACKEWGLFQLINHEVNTEIVDKMKEETQGFFASPFEEKKSLSQVPGEIEGYGQAFVVSNDQKLDWADMFYLVTHPVSLRKPHIWQMLSTSFRSAIENYAIETQKLVIKILELMANNLGMKKEELHESFEDGMQAMRMNYYPPCPQPELVIGLSPHSDGIGLTLLLQLSDVQGLQVKKDGEWIPVSLLQNAFVVNIGDIMEIISNGVYCSVEHRAVVSHDAERMSIATFFSPNMNVEFGPAPSLITPETPPLFKRVGTAEFFKNLFTRKLQGRAYIDDLRIEKRNE